MNFARRPYDPWLAYGQSKTANVLFAVEADTPLGAATASPPTRCTRARSSRRTSPRHMDPGVLAERCVASGELPVQDDRAGRGDERALVAASPLLEGVGGRYFEDCNEAPVVDTDGPDEPASGVAGYAVDPELRGSCGSCRSS